MRRERANPRLALVLALAGVVAGGPAAALANHAALDEAALDEPEAAAAEPGRTREVEPGDTLWSIAASALGDGTLWVAVYRANRDRIKDPARIYPGQRLAVPELDPESMASVRREAASLVAD
ncbi:MAG TPA: LysM peptidoglycan-binding domain-containing protein [Myxococcota bacterium]|nr:LysM peptidoglycan-binding domain-containing protein [Myxococcota bacterium]